MSDPTIPHDRILLTDDGYGWIAFTNTEGPAWEHLAFWHASDRPCDTCHGCGLTAPDFLKPQRPCPDCIDGRHTWVAEIGRGFASTAVRNLVDGVAVKEATRTVRLSVVPGMLLQIVGMPESGYPYPKPDRFCYVSKAGALRVVDSIDQTDTHIGKLSAKPGDWAVKVRLEDVT